MIRFTSNRRIALTALAMFTSAAALAAPNVQVSVSDLHVFPGNVDSTNVPGVTTLSRHQNMVEVAVSTSELQPGHAYSLWWVAFNQPKKCLGDGQGGAMNPSRCVVNDAFNNPDAKASVAWGASFVADSNGAAYVTARLTKNNPPGEVFAGEEKGLTRTRKADIHIVLRGHGVAVPGEVATQTVTFLGGEAADGSYNHQSSAHEVLD